MRTPVATVGLCLLTMVLAGCDGGEPAASNAVAAAAPAAEQKEGITGLLAGSPELSTAARLIKAAGLEETFKGRDSYTLFAPTDAAFAGLPSAQRALFETEEGRPQLVALLRQHVASGYVTPKDLEAALGRRPDGAELASMGAAPLRLHKQGEAIVLGDGDGAPRVTGASLNGSTVMVYPIDRVLPPATR